MAMTQAAGLTLGPLFFHWPPDQWRDFYYHIADEAPVDTVCLGEVVCSKRSPFHTSHLPAVIDRLTGAGKQVVLSTLALVIEPREQKALRDLAQESDHRVEANDAGALLHLRGRPHHIGPFVNVYNEASLAHLAANGAKRVCLPVELPAKSLRALAAGAAESGVELEVFAFGRMPLALSARCYHARAHGLTKDSCQFVCGHDPDGMTMNTLDDTPFLAINGIQTLSYHYALLIRDLPALRQMGIRHFRLSPHQCDMAAIARIFRDVLDERLTAEEGEARASAS
jgi:collagenase-like PrtC family protease